MMPESLELTLATPLLKIDNMSIAYGNVTVVHEISFAVSAGMAFAILGANGAGKTSLLRGISGIKPPHIRSGEGWIGGKPVQGKSAWELARSGLAHVPEGRKVFGDLTVEENLMMGSLAGRRTTRRGRGSKAGEVFELFPRLWERRRQQAGNLSGGEQQMLAIGRGLMSSPEVLLLDEPSLGLSPILVEDLYQRLEILRAGGDIAMVVVEENTTHALSLAQTYLVMRNGHEVLSGAAGDATDGSMIAAYLS